MVTGWKISLPVWTTNCAASVEVGLPRLLVGACGGFFTCFALFL